MPRPCASLTPKRIERNADARNVVYIVLRDRRVDLLVIGELRERPQPRDVRLGFFDRAVGLLQLLPHRRRPAADA